MAVTVRIDGLKQVNAFLQGLGSVLSHPVIQAANAEAVKPFLNKAHRLAPVGKTGGLADSIGVIKTPFAKAGSIGEITAGPRRGLYGGHHAHLMEFGTGPRKVRGASGRFGGANRGVVIKKPFIQPAWESTQNEVLGKVTAILQEKVMQYARRTIRNA